MSTPTYDRLLQSASELKQWKTAADIARRLSECGVDVTDQVMTNWRTRGVSAKGIIESAKHIGCRPIWLYDGTGDMVDLARCSSVREPQPPTYRTELSTPPTIAEVVALMEAATEEQRRACVTAVRIALAISPEHSFTERNAA
jgi:hypothetical protein